MNDRDNIFEKIYQEHIEKIYRFVYLKVGSKQIAEDITSEVFIKTFKSFQQKAEKGYEIKNPQAFLFKTARNLLSNYYRNHSKIGILSIEDIKDIEDSGQSIVRKEIVQEDVDRLFKALSELKDEYQNVLIWYYIEEMSVPEIANILEKSENSVRVTIHRAMNKLKELLSGSESTSS